MFGGAHKPGRGAGGRGGGAKRGVYPLQKPSRSSSAAAGGGGRLSLGGSAPRGRNPSTAAVQPEAVDETFSLVTHGPPSFAAMFRLPRDLVEEIKRVEAQGGTAKIKFDPFPKNAAGNIIDVGGKQFRFTWSDETGDLCDIYEEPQSGEDRNGLLVESGCAYRKLTAQRMLDESTSNHLKKLSQESDKKSNARKTMVLEPSNPLMKSQMKAIAAVETSPWKNFNNNKTKKEPPFKKRKFEPTQAAGPPQVIDKSGFPAAALARGRHSISPMQSPLVQSVSLASPSVAGNSSKTQENTGAATPIHASTEENIFRADKDASGKAFHGVPETAGHRANENVVPADLQSLLTSLLKDNPNGMSFKALEMAVGDVFPGSSRKIEPLLKKIATCKTSGRFVLNSEAEQESSKSYPQNGSTPEGNRHYASGSKEKRDLVASPQVLASVERSPNQPAVDQAALDLLFGEDANVCEEVDILHDSPVPVGEKSSGGKPGGTSDSGSDSDSDSSDSGSDSGSQSRSRSVAESGSGSSSDSESDSAANSKEGSDVDVDIISDDENGPKHVMQSSDQGLLTSPNQWRSSDNLRVENGIAERINDQQSDDVDIDGDQEIDVGTASDLAPNVIVPSEAEHAGQWTENVLNEPVNITTPASEQENEDKSKRSRGKSRKASSMNSNKESNDRTKRIKPGNYAASPASGFQDGVNETQYKDSNLEEENRYQDGNADRASERDYGNQICGTTVVEPQQSGQRPGLSHDTPLKQRSTMYKETQEEGNLSEKTSKRVKESGSGNKSAKKPSSVHRKRQKSSSGPNTGLLQHDDDRDNAGKIPSKNNVLRLEASELELGEVREPLSMNLDANNNDFQRQGSFRQFGTEEGTFDTVNDNLNQGKPVGMPVLDLKQASPFKGARKGSSKRSHHETEIPSNEADVRHEGALRNNANGLEDVHGERHKKANGRRQSESKQECASLSRKTTKSQKSDPSAKIVGRVKNASMNDENNEDRRGVSSDESGSFSMYEKEEPELKGPIKDQIQYNDYVREYRDKFGPYCSLNKSLVKYRNMFLKMEKDLQSSKHKDSEKYNRVLTQLKEIYEQRGDKHKRKKKIFVVLHEELKNIKQRLREFSAAHNKDKS